MRLMLFAILAALSGCGPKESVKGMQVRVIWSEDPATQATIVWTQKSLDSSQVHIGTSPSALSADSKLITSTHQASQYANRFIFSINENPYTAKAHIKNMTPNQPYYFRVVNEKESSPIYWFKTAPESGPIALLAGGDSRSNHDARKQINLAMKEIWRQNPDIIAFSHGGDYVADGADWNQWLAWLNDYQLTTQDDGRILPIIPTRGNHEYYPVLFNQVFGFDPEFLDYFNSKIGDLNFLTLNSEISITGDQYTWLENELKRSQTDQVMTFVSYHRPAYPAVKRPSTTKKWVPLFEKYGVTLALESDGHTFKRTVPIYQDQEDFTKGVIYLGEGGLGVAQRSPKLDRWYLQGEGTAFKKNHFILLRQSKNHYSVQVFDEDKNLFYQF